MFDTLLFRSDINCLITQELLVWELLNEHQFRIWWITCWQMYNFFLSAMLHRAHSWKYIKDVNNTIQEIAAKWNCDISSGSMWFDWCKNMVTRITEKATKKINKKYSLLECFSFFFVFCPHFPFLTSSIKFVSSNSNCFNRRRIASSNRSQITAPFTASKF